jgi:hypothetical protein
MARVTEPFPIFYDDDGTPLENGMIYIGTAGDDARANPLSVFLEANPAVAAEQPIRTLGGRPAYQGAPTNIAVGAANYSILVLNKYGTPITSDQNVVSDDVIVSVTDFGAVGDGVTDDTAAVQAALDSLATGGVVFMPAGVYKIDADLTVPNGVTLDGGIRNPDPGRAGNPPALARTPRIALASSATITLRNGSAIQGLYIQRQGLVAGEDPTTWTGTAITVLGNGTFQGDLFVAGFNRWCDATSALDDERCARLRAERVLFDCRNGIVVSQCFDIPYLMECHGNDLTSATTTLRDGVGFEISNEVDWARVTNCFTYGYAVGFRVDDANETIFTNCGADYLPAGTATSIGFDISGTSRTTKLIGCQSAATGTAVRVDVGTAVFPQVIVDGCSFWDIDTAGVSLLSGNVTVIGSAFNGGNMTAILTANSADATSVVAIGNTFNDPTTVFNIQNASTLNRSVFVGNRLIDCADSTVGDFRGFEAGQRDAITLRSANDTNVGARFEFDKARGTLASPTVPSASDSTLNLIGRGWTGTEWGANAQIRAQFEGAPGAGSTPGRVIFSTTPSGAVASVDRWSVQSNGDFLPLTNNTHDFGSSSLIVRRSYVATRYYNSTVADFVGSGSPEGVLTAGIGSTYRRTDGGAGTSFYVKESGTGNTGWVGK